MTHTERLLRVPATFRRLTGLSPEAFARLLGQLEAAWQQDQARRARRPGRRRKPGAGRPPALALADRLLMLLVYYRTYVPYAFLGFLFGLDDSNACRSNRRLEPLLAGIFRIPERKVALSPDEVRELFFDGTERPTNRPKRGQRRYYSGKKRRHTLKHQLVVARRKKRPGPGPKRQRLRIAAVSKAFGGSAHDKRVFDRTGAAVPPGARGYGDTAYLGTGLKTPKRKPAGGQLTKRQKAGNRRVGRKRVVAEHAIGKMKTWRIAAERWRNPRRRHALTFKNVAGLHNLMFAA
jgi:DDE superfamily endonuclease/Helix-turn-helix of DDE superfamily endonuclease